MFRTSKMCYGVLAKAGYRTAASKPIEFLPSRLVVEKPYNFHAIHTNYGWFIIPKPYYAYRWTTLNIHKAIEDRYPDIKEVPRSHEVLQEVVDDWGRTVDISTKPIMTKTTRADIKKQKDEALYRTQLKEDIPSLSISSKQTAVPKKRSRLGTVTFIHAWNYYFSITHPKYSHLDKKESRREIANEWNALTTEEKDDYREAYANLLNDGKDIHKGKIVSREEKLKKQSKKKKKSEDK
ncbi:uncharacterized protein AC631_01328 [Debaryomyces fabryi]|uniref:Uncharacterized protein n=1 Tax=Debaryomyces fabryi TaxID=58627 RepID=A0A0V1Q3B7_9ASCO|nr:uncharacterized protein AC631_01328 [Debaryomyces fabryi]KSA02963.1 hypothetical protein AC631_01328 [Debaryomyces fabryi]CUM50932.1 unnamed protein product [Debaryomyces fabryi]